MSDNQKEFYIAHGICKAYPNDDMPFEKWSYVWEYIQQSKSTYYLNLLSKVVPLGMLKYRLNERLKYLEQESTFDTKKE